MPEIVTGKKVIPSWDLLEQTDPEEWMALSDENKQVFQLIISAGTLYFTSGGSMREMLLGMFPVGTITGDKYRLM
jgi:hypothetical protein